MSETAPTDLVSAADYLAFEATSEYRHEFIDGRIVAMTGASKRHNLVASELLSLLKGPGRAHGCETYIEGVRLRVNDATYVYPDVMVTCETSDDEYEVTEPCLVAEVLSPSTSWVDHGRKRTAYLGLASLRHYLLLNQSQNTIEHYSRTSADVDWTVRVVVSGETLHLDCPPAEIAVAELFR